jgi:hypothetical protein
MKISIRQSRAAVEGALTWADFQVKEERAAREERPTARITCRVCGLPATVDANNSGLLCGPCRVDTIATRLHVESVMEASEARWRTAYETFEAQAGGEPRWGQIAAARHTAEPSLFAEAWRRRKAEGGSLGVLLSASEALDALSDELTRRREWAALALEEIDAAEQG